MQSTRCKCRKNNFSLANSKTRNREPFEIGYIDNKSQFDLFSFICQGTMKLLAAFLAFYSLSSASIAFPGTTTGRPHRNPTSPWCCGGHTQYHWWSVIDTGKGWKNTGRRLREPTITIKGEVKNKTTPKADIPETEIQILEIADSKDYEDCGHEEILLGFGVILGSLALGIAICWSYKSKILSSYPFTNYKPISSSATNVFTV